MLGRLLFLSFICWAIILISFFVFIRFVTFLDTFVIREILFSIIVVSTIIVDFSWFFKSLIMVRNIFGLISLSSLINSLILLILIVLLERFAFFCAVVCFLSCCNFFFSWRVRFSIERILLVRLLLSFFSRCAISFKRSLFVWTVAIVFFSVIVSIRRTFVVVFDLEMMRNRLILLVRLAWVSLYNSVEKSFMFSTRTRLLYFSSNSVIVFFVFVVSRFMMLVSIGKLRRICVFIRFSIVRIFFGFIVSLCEKSKRSILSLISEFFCDIWVFRIWRSVACIRCVAEWFRRIRARRVLLILVCIASFIFREFVVSLSMWLIVWSYFCVFFIVKEKLAFFSSFLSLIWSSDFV